MKTEVKNNSKKILFNDEEFNDIKEGFEDVDIDEDLEEMNEIKTEAKKNKISLAKLFVRCYEILESNYYILEDDKLKSKIESFLKDFYGIENIKDMIEEYGDGKDIGSYYLGERIIDVVIENRSKIDYFIKFFFRVFGGEN